MSMNGNLVHFVLADGPEHMHGQCRPALVVQDWDPTADGQFHMLNLVVFRDGDNDHRILVGPSANRPAQYDDSLMEWRTSVNHSLTHEFGTWHRPEDCNHSQEN